MKISDGELQHILRYDLKLTAAQVRELVADSRQTHQSLHATVRKAKVVDDVAIAKAQAKRLGVPFADLTQNPPASAINALPYQLAMKYKMICFDQTSTSVKLAMADPRNEQARQAARDYFGKTVRRYLTTEAGLIAALRHYDKSHSPLPFSSRELLATILEQASRAGASDIHFKPHQTNLLVTQRIGHDVKTLATLPIERYSGLISWCKLHSGDSSPQADKPHTGTFNMILGGQRHQIMVSTLPLLSGQNLVLRILPPHSGIPSLPDCGLSSSQAKQLNQAINDGNGLLLIAGINPGATDTLLTSLAAIAGQQPNGNTTVIQQQARYTLANCTQIEVTNQLPMPVAIRDVILQNPSTIVVDNLGDGNSAQELIDFALSRHLVIAGTYGATALSAFRHLLRHPIAPALVSASIRSLLVEHNYQQLCTHCRVKFSPTGPLKKALAQQFGFADDAQLYRKGPGCEACNKGNKATASLFELIRVSHDLQQLLATKADDDALTAQLLLDSDLQATVSKLASSGKISIDEATKLIH